MYGVCLFLSCLSLVFAKTAFKEDKDVAILTKDIFHSVLEEYPYVMVEFYAPWCGHCQALKPEYEKAASLLKNELKNVLIAKVDATVESELATEFGVMGYPTIKFRRNGAWIDYQGERTSSSIVDWIKRKLEPSLKVLASVSDVQKFVDANEFGVVTFMKTENSDYRKVVEEVADKMDDYTFAIASASDILDKYGVKSDFQVTAFKKFDEREVVYDGQVNVDDLTAFVNRESIELIVEFSQESAAKVFRSPIRMQLLAFVPKSGDFDKLKKEMTPVAKTFKGKVHFVLIDTDFEDHARISDAIGVSKEELPGYRLLNLTDDMTKYKPDKNDFSEATMVPFINDVLSGKRKPFLKSEEIPADSSGPVRVLVGKNYNEVTQDESKAVFVKLYAPWCGHCKQLAPIWDELGQIYKDRTDIVIAKLDATMNDVDGLTVRAFPTLTYYPKGSAPSVEYNGDRTLEALRKFVDSDGKEDATKKSESAETRDEL